MADINKTQVREIARELGLSIASKKDSTGICFIGERDFRRFLGNYMPMKEGRIINVSTGKPIGTHKGVFYYTIGQRKGLDIGGTGPYYCIGKSIAKNELYVADERHQSLLYSTACLVKGVNWLADRTLPLKCAAKFRYRQSDQDVEIRLDCDGGLMASYPQGIRSVTPGQEAVFYDGEVVVAAGRIEQVFKDGEDLMEKVVSMAEGGAE